jgi:hypothetical protein
MVVLVKVDGAKKVLKYTLVSPFNIAHYLQEVCEKSIIDE